MDLGYRSLLHFVQSGRAAGRAIYAALARFSCVSNTVFIALCVLSAGVGAAVGRWRLVPIALAGWALVIAVVAVTGGFHATAEDNSLGVFFFTAVPALLWVFCIAAGVFGRHITEKPGT